MNGQATPAQVRIWPSLEARQWLGWIVPAGYTPIRLGACRGCHVQVAWLESLRGRPCPFDRDGISHFATCPEAPRFRAGRRVR